MKANATELCNTFYYGLPAGAWPLERCRAMLSGAGIHRSYLAAVVITGSFCPPHAGHLEPTLCQDAFRGCNASWWLTATDIKMQSSLAVCGKPREKCTTCDNM
eukprot:5055436-Amphidinium_carterae.1